MREGEGKERYFVPRMKKLIRNSGMESHAKTFLDKLGIKDRVEPTQFDIYLNNVSDEVKSYFEKSTGLKWEDYIKAHKTAMALQKDSNPSNVSVSSMIDKDNPFNNK